MDKATQTELEAAAFRRLVAHLQDRTDVQNIDMMNLTGFCRNCMSRWYREAAEADGITLSDPEARKLIYGMDYATWKATYQTEASPDQLAKMKQSHNHELMTKTSLNFTHVESLRRSMLLTHRDMAKLFGVTRMTYHSWVRGKGIRRKKAEEVRAVLKELLDVMSDGWPQPDVIAADQKERFRKLLEVLGREG